MSNEYKDWMRDQAEEAKEWVSKYPFLRFKDNSCCPWEKTEEIESCWMFDLPVGWQIGFGEQMCDELMAVLGKYADDFIILQLKEKFNQIRLYWGWVDKERSDEDAKVLAYIYDDIEDVISKYEEISYNTCVHCGQPAEQYNECGWISGWCKSCYEKRYEYD